MEEFTESEVIETVISEPQKKKCKSCQKYTGANWIMLLFSFYILFAAIYGTIKLIHELF